MRPRLIHLATAALLVPLGFATKLYAGPGAAWLSDSVGGLLYVLFFCVLALALRPRWSPVAVAAWVLVLTSAVEVMQLWHPAWLEPIRANFLGHALLGSTFAWMDFPYYAAGALAGYGYGWLARRWLAPQAGNWRQRGR